ncbi:MAG TPA: hypothetical protein VER16_07110 [Stenotrophomonas sp.]|nr:hypothetical protein [Stenotrophomonas sp.]
MNTPKILLTSALALTVAGCMEVASTEYADRDQAVSRNAIGESKWLPAWLPEDAVDIRETHDMDTNETWLVFHPASGFFVFPEDCRPASKPEMSDARTMRRFPKFARSAWSRASGYTGEFRLCPEGGADRWIIHDEELRLVYSSVKFE